MKYSTKLKHWIDFATLEALGVSIESLSLKVHLAFKKILHAIWAENKSEAAKMEYKIKQLERNEKITYFMKHADLLF